MLALATDAGYPDPERLARYEKQQRVDVPARLENGEFLWLQGAIEDGMAPMDALLAATRNVAAAYRKPDLGTLEVGKKADLVVLDADPLADPHNYRKIHAVMANGHSIARDTLPTHSVFQDELRDFSQRKAE